MRPMSCQLQMILDAKSKSQLDVVSNVTCASTIFFWVPLRDSRNPERHPKLFSLQIKGIVLHCFMSSFSLTLTNQISLFDLPSLLLSQSLYNNFAISSQLIRHDRRHAATHEDLARWVSHHPSPARRSQARHPRHVG